MTDNTQWQSPEGEPSRGASTPAPPPSGAPVTSTPAPPVYGAAPPVYGAAPPVYGASHNGWTPPPKPGLIPLRPLDLGTILGASFRVLRRNPRPTFGAALLFVGVSYLLFLGIIGVATFSALSRISFSTADTNGEITAGSIGLIGLSSLVPALLSLVGSAIVQGLIVLEVSRATIGEKLTFRQLWRQARGRFGALIGWSALLVLAAIMALALLLIVIGVTSTLGVVGAVVAVLAGIFGGLALVAVFAWLGTKLTLVPSALMVERLSLRGAISRSWQLTNGFFWRTFGILVLVAAILGVASQVISAPLGLLGPFLTTLVDPQGQVGGAAIALGRILAVLAVVVTVTFQSITAVISAAATALVYLDLRIRREGLDLELAHFVEARAAGDLSVADPLLHRKTQPPPIPLDAGSRLWP